MITAPNPDPLVLYGQTFTNRLLLGTSHAPARTRQHREPGE